MHCAYLGNLADPERFSPLSLSSFRQSPEIDPDLTLKLTGSDRLFQADIGHRRIPSNPFKEKQLAPFVP